MGMVRNFFTLVGCATVVTLTGAGAWLFRSEIAGAYRSFRNGVAAGSATHGAAVSVGRPSEDARRSAEAKEAALQRSRGPAYVVLSADEVASLIGFRLAPTVRAAIDSLTVNLSADRVTLNGQVRLDLFGRDLLGPLADYLDSRQPLTIGGPVGVREPGALAWSVDEFVIREFAFPQAAVPPLVRRLAGDTAGAFLLPVPETVGDVRVRSDGITFYRKSP